MHSRWEKPGSLIASQWHFLILLFIFIFTPTSELICSINSLAFGIFCGINQIFFFIVLTSSSRLHIFKTSKSIATYWSTSKLPKCCYSCLLTWFLCLLLVLVGFSIENVLFISVKFYEKLRLVHDFISSLFLQEA